MQKNIMFGPAIPEIWGAAGCNRMELLCCSDKNIIRSSEKTQRQTGAESWFHSLTVSGVGSGEKRVMLYLHT